MPRSASAKPCRRWADIASRKCWPNPATRDLSAHVDFTALAEAARHGGAQVFGPQPQGTFLNTLGIKARARQLIEANPAAAQAVSHAVERLTAPAQMGTLFQAMALLPQSAPSPPGF